MFQRLLPHSFIKQAELQAKQRRHNCVYSSLVVMWLMAAQRLRGGAPLEVAVVELLGGLPAHFWPRPAKRIRDWRWTGKAPSYHTGAYNQARQALALSVVQNSCDRIFQTLAAELESSHSGQHPRAFLLDGSSMRLAHSAELVQRFPPGANQHGEGHWPVAVVLVAHDLWTGLAMRPEWGPMYGPNAVSEQKLLAQAINRLPPDATVIADSNFGVFSVAHVATQAKHPVLLRLTAARAKRIGGQEMHDGVDRVVGWRPSPHERHCHTELSKDASVTGRLIVRRVRPSNGAAPFLLALFTTLELPVAQILALYGQRWNIETDLRTLKKTLRLDQLTSTTVEMVEKEIEIGVAAYNLVRAMILVASRQSGAPPRSYSFTSVARIVQAYSHVIANAAHPAAAEGLFEQMVRHIQQSKHPSRRKRRPSYPRQVWQRGKYFPTHKT